jgi:hypothetical protein
MNRHREPKSALFAWLISHQPAVLFSRNKPASSNQAKVLFLSEQTSTSRQPPAIRTGRRRALLPATTTGTKTNGTVFFFSLESGRKAAETAEIQLD